MVGIGRVLAKAGQLFTLSSPACQGSAVSASNICSAFAGLSKINCVRYNSNRASICRINRLQYLRHYPTVVVNPDGSTYTIRYREPRQIIHLPVDLNTLSGPEKQKHLDRRKPKTKVSLDEEFDDSEFDSSKYLKLVKKK